MPKRSHNAYQRDLTPASGWRSGVASLLYLVSVHAFAHSEKPVFPDTVDRAEWRYVGMSYGGDDVYVNTKRAHRLDGDSGATRVLVLVNRMNCGEGPRPGSREAARVQCVNSFGYASYIVEHIYWCDANT